MPEVATELEDELATEDLLDDEVATLLELLLLDETATLEDELVLPTMP